jgi:hypothetical protein
VIRARLISLSLAAAIVAGGSGAVLPSAATAAKPTHVIIGPAKTKPGDHCAKGVSGCQGGKFTGNFFG